MPKYHALVTGTTGQDASYLIELLLAHDYEVYGLLRRTSQPNTANISHLLSDLRIVEGDMSDYGSLFKAVTLSRPHEVYNLAAQSHVGTSYTSPEHTLDITGTGAARLFEAVRLGCPLSDHVRIYQASSSEMFGNSPSPQNESTPFAPESPYAAAKVLAHHMASVYRRSYGMFIACGIAFNHESERRGEEFVTRRITKGIGAIKRGTQTELRLGNLQAKRDWSHAKDIVRAAWLMLQHDRPLDLVLASGHSRSVQEFVEQAFNVAGLDWQQHVKVDPTRMRPSDVMDLCGDSTRARRLLDWQPEITFNQLVTGMVVHDLPPRDAGNG